MKPIETPPSLYLTLDSPSLETSFRPTLPASIDQSSSLDSKDSLHEYLAERSDDSRRSETDPKRSPRFNFDSKDAAEITTLRVKVDQLQRENARLMRKQEEASEEVQKLKHELRAQHGLLGKYSRCKYRLHNQHKEIGRLLQIHETDLLTIKALKEERKQTGNVQFLTEQVENLVMELESRPTHKQYKEALHRLMEAESERSRSCTRIGPLNNTRHMMRKDKQAFNVPKPESGFLNELMQLLKVQNVTELVPAVSKYANGYVFVEKLCGLVKEGAPKGTFRNEPTNVQIWKYVRRLVGDRRRNEEILDHLKRVLRVSEYEQIVEAVQELV